MFSPSLRSTYNVNHIVILFLVTSFVVFTPCLAMEKETDGTPSNSATQKIQEKEKEPAQQPTDADDDYTVDEKDLAAQKALVDQLNPPTEQSSWLPSSLTNALGTASKTMWGIVDTVLRHDYMVSKELQNGTYKCENDEDIARMEHAIEQAINHKVTRRVQRFITRCLFPDVSKNESPIPLKERLLLNIFNYLKAEKIQLIEGLPTLLETLEYQLLGKPKKAGETQPPACAFLVKSKQTQQLLRARGAQATQSDESEIEDYIPSKSAPYRHAHYITTCLLQKEAKMYLTSLRANSYKEPTNNRRVSKRPRTGSSSSKTIATTQDTSAWIDVHTETVPSEPNEDDLLTETMTLSLNEIICPRPAEEPSALTKIATLASTALNRGYVNIVGARKTVRDDIKNGNFFEVPKGMQKISIEHRMERAMQEALTAAETGDQFAALDLFLFVETCNDKRLPLEINTGLIQNTYSFFRKYKLGAPLKTLKTTCEQLSIDWQKKMDELTQLKKDETLVIKKLQEKGYTKDDNLSDEENYSTEKRASYIFRKLPQKAQARLNNLFPEEEEETEKPAQAEEPPAKVPSSFAGNLIDLLFS